MTLGSRHDLRFPQAMDFVAQLRGLLELQIDPTPEMTLLDIGAIRAELRKLLGVRVDVLTPAALPDRFREAVLAEAKPI